PTSETLPGRIGLSAAGNTNSFGYFTSPYIEVEKGRDYQATFVVSSSIEDSNLVPQFRMRVYQDSTHSSWNMGVNSYDNVAPTWNNPKAYNIYFTPQMLGSTDKINLNFDIISFDAADDFWSWLYLEEATVSKLR
ncbi:MAG: hypothetical protein N2246_07485, partial [Candidatus Sumerlaeia bacterium]|nr:hypothetical protein [Candidatus Sumerlaeia bacterium]